jgi:hypothetical protein
MQDQPLFLFATVYGAGRGGQTAEYADMRHPSPPRGTRSIASLRPWYRLILMWSLARGFTTTTPLDFQQGEDR